MCDFVTSMSIAAFKMYLIHFLFSCLGESSAVVKEQADYGPVTKKRKLNSKLIM